MNPFVSVNVQPAYGDREVLIDWQVLPVYADGMFFVYRSLTGEAPWELLNPRTEDGQVIALGNESFVDDMFVLRNRVTEAYYRLLLRMDDGAEFESPIVSMFGKITRRQWGAVNKMLKREQLRMRSGNGVEVLHYIPLAAGEISPNYDADTGQHLRADCPDPADDSYGLKFKGGFGPPILTHVEMIDVGPIIFQDNAEGQGHDDPITVRAHMLAHPKPRRGHMIVHPPSDNRYVVGDTIKGYYFRGIVAIRYDVELQLLRRNDSRYRVPVPEDILMA